MSRRSQVRRMTGPVISLAALVMTVSVGCGGPPHATFFATEPAAMSFGGSSELSIIQVEGRRDVREEFREEFVRELRRQAREDGYWTVSDKTNLDAEISTSGAASIQPGEREVLLRLDVHIYESTRAAYEESQRVRSGSNPDGSARYRTETVTRTGQEGRCVFSVYSVHGDNHRVMSGTEFDQRYMLRRDDPFQARERVLRAAVREFLDEITPRMRRARVRLDDQYDDMKDVISLARNRDYGQAAGILESMRQQYPDRPDVLYNLAVMYDAMGDYDQAGRLYDEAISLGGRDFYVRSRNDFESRRRAAEEMHQ